MSALSIVGDWVMWAAGGVLAPILGVVKRNRDRSIQNQRQLQGDPTDPNSEGVLTIAKETRHDVKNLERRMDKQHRELKTILEEKT